MTVQLSTLKELKPINSGFIYGLNPLSDESEVEIGKTRRKQTAISGPGKDSRFPVCAV